jgi:uncharacterized membrane protein
MPRPNHLKRKRRKKSKLKPMKNPFASKTVWGLVILVISNILVRFGVESPSEQLHESVNFLSANWELISTFLTAVGAFLGIWGRKDAKKPISLNPFKGAGKVVGVFIATLCFFCLFLFTSCATSPSIGFNDAGEPQGCVQLIGLGPVDLTVCADRSNRD